MVVRILFSIAAAVSLSAFIALGTVVLGESFIEVSIAVLIGTVGALLAHVALDE